LVVTRIIHQAQGLTLDYFAFDPNNVYKHGFLVLKKRKFLPLATFVDEFFQIDPNVVREMH
jgi:hypothetical protein